MHDAIQTSCQRARRARAGRILAPQRFQDDGSKLGVGLKIATNYFLLEEIEYLNEILKKKYKLINTIHKGGKGKGYAIYIDKKNKEKFKKIVLSYMLPSMLYKLR